ncbi:hypothetical protein ILYODFUR_024392 [Ilyodon furcidens]|uniref:Uncharacterized protein n=1 Tax=Ilyodon furcidens TaxID=33524 RepID=A0ABV0U9D3_9TELE
MLNMLNILPPPTNRQVSAASIWKVRFAWFIFPDLTSTVMKKRQAFQTIREKCRSNGIRYGFRYPAKFVVTVNNNTAMFDTPGDAEKFLSRESANWRSETE